MSHLSHLENLNLSGCQSLQELPEGIWQLKRLKMSGVPSRFLLKSWSKRLAVLISSFSPNKDAADVGLIGSADHDLADNNSADNNLADNNLADNNLVDNNLADNELADKESTDEEWDDNYWNGDWSDSEWANKDKT